MRGLPLYSPATHLHGFCSLPNLRVYYIKKILLAKVSQTGFITPSVPFAERQFIKMKKKVNYTKEFKVKACELVLKDEVKVKTVADKMGIGHIMLYRWIDEYKTYGDAAFVGKGHLKPEEAKLKKLQKENEELRQQVEILKKAAAYFAKENKNA